MDFSHVVGGEFSLGVGFVFMVLECVIVVFVGDVPRQVGGN